MNSSKRGHPSEGRLTESSETSGRGATWHRIDLHLHTPQVHAFAPPKGIKREDRKGLTDAYVEQLAAQEFSVAAITDYNGVNAEWFEVTAAKATNRGITLLPGTELTFRQGQSGLHLLAIFPGDTDLKGLNAFLRSLDKDPSTPLSDSQGSHRDMNLRIGLAEALKDLRSRFHCLFVFPHPDRANGLCKSLTAEAAARLLVDIAADAIESLPEKEKKSLQSTGLLPKDFWNRMAVVEFSNPKRIEEIGKQYRTDGILRATYLKLSATNLDALRMALHDPETRLSIGGIPPATHPRIQSMSISGPGFLGNLSISWNQDLNVIIGAKGAGKSAILETLRYAFAIPPRSDQSDREEFVRHALGSGGRVEVILDRPLRDGKVRQYRIVRVCGEEPKTFQVNPEKPLSVGPSELLSPTGGFTFFGHREIYAAAGSEEHRLAILDEMIGEEALRCADSVTKAAESLAANASAIVELQVKQAKREEYCQQLKKIDQEIEIQKRRATEGFKDATIRQDMGEGLKNATNVVRGVLAESDQRRLQLLASLEKAHRSLLDAQSGDKELLQESAKVLALLQESLKVVLDDETTLFEQAVQSLTRLDMRWQEKLRRLEKERARADREAQKDRSDQDPLRKLAEERTALSSSIAELDGIGDRLKPLRQKRQELLQQIRESRDTQTGLRRERADAIAQSLNGRLRLQVDFKGQKGSYKKQLSSLLKGAGLSQDAIDKLVGPEATDGIAISEAVQAGSKEVQRRFGLEPTMAEHLIGWFAAEESRVFELESLIPQDALRLELKVDGQYQSFEHLSADQAAAAFLLFLLGLKNRILIIDQPDDYLGDKSVHEEVLQMLREQKGLKTQGSESQVIMATNDASLPVIADAELVVPLEVRDHHALILDRGSIDQRSIRQLIKTVMRGADEAFRQRLERYGGLAPG
jgi:hypothetical protein